MSIFSRALERELAALCGRNATTRHVGELLQMSEGPARLAHAVQVASVEQLRAVLAFARAREVRIAPLGKGHASRVIERGQPIIFLSNAMRPKSRMVEPYVAQLGAGTTWVSVERALKSVGRQMPVTTDYLGLTVAGTICQGGYGIDSVAKGMQGDHVLELCAMTASGELVHCASGHPMFDLTVAGLFSVGFLVSVKTRITQRPSSTRIVTFALDKLGQFPAMVDRARERYGADVLTADLTWFPRGRGISCRFGLGNFETRRAREDQEGSIGLRPVAVEVVTDYRQILHRSVDRWYRRFRGYGKVWLDYLVPLHRATEFSEAVRGFCETAQARRTLECGYMVPVVRAMTGPRLPFAAAPEGGRAYMLVGLYFMPVQGPSDRAALVRAAEDRLLRTCLDLGGRPYQQSRHELSIGEMIRIYGEEYRQACEYGASQDGAEVFGSWGAWRDGATGSCL